MAWIGAIVQGVMGGIQMGVAKAELDALPDPQGFSTSSDLATATSMARRAAQQGMSPAERAAAEQAIGTEQSRMQRSMEQRGLGNLAAAVSQIRTTEAMNALAAQNAQIKRQSLGQYAQLAGQMQQLQDQNTRSFNQMLYAQQQALGQAAQSGFQNLAGMGGSIAMAIEGADAAKEEAIGDDAVDFAAEDKAFLASGAPLAPWTPEGTQTKYDETGPIASVAPGVDPSSVDVGTQIDPKLFGSGGPTSSVFGGQTSNFLTENLSPRSEPVKQYMTVGGEYLFDEFDMDDYISAMGMSGRGKKY